MKVTIPDERWNPLSLPEVTAIFADAPFQWGVAGGYAVELFLGASIRAHDDIDVTIFRDDQLKAQHWLEGWQLYAADPPGTLRVWGEGEYLPFGVHDIWGHQARVEAWQLQLMLAEVEGEEWFNRRNPAIRGQRHDLIAEYGGVPCVRVEVQLMYKSKGRRPKDELDFAACLPRMSAESRQWLSNSLRVLYPDSHPWLNALAAARVARGD
jgi:hypothetical protein